jgi:serine/threonine protein kinase
MVAIKFEPRDSKFLNKEYNILKEMEGVIGFPEIYNYKYSGTQKALIMELLGESLFARQTNKENPRLGPMLVLSAFSQLLLRFKALHNAGYLHRDVKPHNMLLGRNETCKRVYLIDFGISCKYMDKATKTHLPQKIYPINEINGTVEFASLNTHRGVT